MAFFIIQIIAFISLTKVSSPVPFEIILLLIMTCYGGGFSTLPAFLSDMFGLKQLSTIHGYELTAWGIAGIVGPTVVSRVLEATGRYNLTLYVFACAFVVAFVVSCIMAKNIVSLRKAQEVQDMKVENVAKHTSA